MSFDGFTNLFGSSRGATAGMLTQQSATMRGLIEQINWGANDEKFYRDHAWEILEKQTPLTPKLKGHRIIASTQLLWDASSPKQKKYQGHVMVDEHGQLYYGFTWGGLAANPQSKLTPVNNINTALACIDEQLDKKLRGKSSSSRYTVMNGGFYERLTAHDVGCQFHNSAYSLHGG
jgi:hypothetical protein